MKKYSIINAFTLIELSIVLVIIGIIIGGILEGIELINQVRIRRLIMDMDSVQTAINGFKLKFGYLPGDFPNAGAIWTSATCTNSTVRVGCNGNANSQVDLNGYLSGAEMYRFWQHLTLANMMDGTRVGTSAASDQFKSSYSDQTYFGVRYTQPFRNSIYYNLIEIGGWISTGGNVASLEAIRPIDAYNIDLKIDDGKANAGNIFSSDGAYTAARLCSYSFNTDNNGLPSYNLLGTQGYYCRIQKAFD